MTRSIPKRRAAAAVELAIVLPVLALMALACLDFGRFAYHHVAVTNAARAGGEHAITNSFTPDSQATWEFQVEQAVRAEITNQTGADPERLTATTTSFVDPNGRRRARVEVVYTGFSTLVSWPGIPDNPVMRSAVEMPSIR